MLVSECSVDVFSAEEPNVRELSTESLISTELSGIASTVVYPTVGLGVTIVFYRYSWVSMVVA